MHTQRMTVRTKLSIGFGLLTGAVLLVSGLSIEALSASNERFSSYVDGINARANVAEDVRTAVDRRAIAARNLVLVTEPADLDIEKAAVTQAHEDVQNNLRKLNDMIARSTDASADTRARIAEIDRIESLYGPVALAIVDLALKGKHAEAIAKMNGECRPLLASLVKATQGYSDATNIREAQLVKESAEHYANQRMLVIGVCLGSVLAALLAGVFITRGILRALGAEPDQLGEVARRVASGDLGPVADADRAHPDSVLASMSAMQKSLVGLIGDVRASADSIATGSSQIATGNIDLSTRTEQQAASLEETASSMEQLTATVRQNAENAQQASTLSATASAVAQQGNAVVGRVVDTMSSISSSSSKIADITGIIEGIAFQTNILALNAAVEAARAGEEGRGFAVVASEVRSLAQRSSTAAKEIKELINVSVETIADGSALASTAGSTMADVLQAVARVSDIMGEIAAASGEQSRGIEQVNVAIAQMDQVTQQNAALVEEAAAASQSLDEQGRRLTQAVAFFKLTTA
ncbi:methyl-accepting chemotaxis protein [Caballeronia arationis]|uniref:Methyl-accepting chemotaxis protein n=1 Tax=Caballeronia arationis TaxID=1777142 RepID=A0A7Z7I5H9_9BURK|nr:methyl-accepting chemotaxis protein [Caballeronia arationis]SAL07009.1 methyl-accepting chemotaxis protein [Caballeronia arationis]SOE57826.1 Methyl-accepting chemotaxis protein [Caballeronia arationis]